MLGPPVDAWYGWLGASIVAAGLLGVAVALPTAPPPDAADVARAVDATASSSYAGTSVVDLSRAETLRLTPGGVTIRGAGGSAHASFRYGPVTPVSGRAGPLAAVLDGTPPEQAFDAPSDLERAARLARNGDRSWRTAPETLRVRHVTWEGVDVTLVG